ncbi:MAG: isochorismatase [Spirochaetales bacterium]|nr:isochorismatase [Spirochaetales bacterium]
MARDSNSRYVWIAKNDVWEIPFRETGLVICDVWDRHWCRGAAEREADMVETMDRVAVGLRQKGVLIIHAPSDTMDFYADSPARKRALEVPSIEPPAELHHEDPPLPVDASDGGCDSDDNEGSKNERVWTRQHALIRIDEDRDVISDDGRQIYSIMANAGVSHLIIIGVHTNMCILDRSFAIKQMVRWGVDITLCRDLTDSMYNPALPPYVDHDRGTQLIIEYIEKFWCPTIPALDLL